MSYQFPKLERIKAESDRLIANLPLQGKVIDAWCDTIRNSAAIVRALQQRDELVEDIEVMQMLIAEGPQQPHASQRELADLQSQLILIEEKLRDFETDPDLAQQHSVFVEFRKQLLNSNAENLQNRLAEELWNYADANRWKCDQFVIFERITRSDQLSSSRDASPVLVLKITGPETGYRLRCESARYVSADGLSLLAVRIIPVCEAMLRQPPEFVCRNGLHPQRPTGEVNYITDEQHEIEVFADVRGKHRSKSTSVSYLRSQELHAEGLRDVTSVTRKVTSDLLSMCDERLGDVELRIGLEPQGITRRVELLLASMREC